MVGGNDITPLRWFLVNGKYVCVPNKCGWTSFKVAVSGLRRTPDFLRYMGVRAFTAPGTPAFISIRNPVDRFRSLWAHVNRKDLEVPEEGFIARWGLRGLSPGGLMDVVQEYPDGNEHWIPQASYWSEGVSFIQHDKMLWLLGLPEVRENASPAISEPMPEDRILRHYARDAAYSLLAVARPIREA